MKEQLKRAPAKERHASPAPNKRTAAPALPNLAFQLFTNQSAAAEQNADAAASAVTRGAPPPSIAPATPGTSPEAAPYGTIIDDALDLGPEQIHRTEFITRLEREIHEQVDRQLRLAGRTVAECPYLNHWMRFYTRQSALHIERAIQRYAQPERHDPDGLHQAVLARVTLAVDAWLASGGREVQAPPGVQPLGGTDDIPEGAAPPVQAWSEGPGGASPRGGPAVLARLGSGRPLGADVRGRMESRFGQSFESVRLHTGERAARVNSQYRSRAFAVGENIAFNTGQYRPGTMQGDLLIAHELAHVVQQRGGGVYVGDQEDAGLESDAHLAAARVVLPDNRDQLALQRSALRLSRCGGGPGPIVEIPQSDYDQAVAELRLLYARKRGIVAGTEPAEALTQINDQIGQYEDRLASYGIRLDGERLMAAVESGRNLMQMTGRILRIPDGTINFGDRVHFQMELDYIPIGRTIETEWRWTTPGDTREYWFDRERGNNQQYEVGEGFWMGARGNNIGVQHGFEALVHCYLGSSKVEAIAPLRTGFIPIVEQGPSNLAIETAQSAIVQGSTADFQIARWAPYHQDYSVDWFVDGNRVASGQPKLRRKFDDVGEFRVSARVYHISRGFFSDDMSPAADEVSQALHVVEPSAAGEQALQEIASAPLPTASALETSVQASMGEISRHVAQGGEQQPYWSNRLSQQQTRLQQVGQFLDPGHAQPLPADAAQVQQTTSYTQAIPAVLVVPNAGGAQPLMVYVTARFSGGQWNASVVDATSAELTRLEGTGATALDAYKDAFRQWMSHHPYPRGGRILYRFSPTGWDLPQDFGTNNAWNLAESWLNGIIEIGGIVLAGLLLMAPTGGATQALGLIVLAATVARSSMAIYQNVLRGMDAFDSRNALEVVNILLAALGFAGTALRLAGVRVVGPLLYRIGNWAVMATLAGDVATTIYCTEEGMAQMRIIRADPTLDEGTRQMMLLRITASLIMQGVMLVVSNREMFRNGLRRSDFFRTNPQEVADAAITRQAAGQPITLEPGARLDIAADLRARGDSLPRVREAAAGELVNRYSLIPWLENTLTAPEIRPMLQRMETPTLVAMGDIPASQAKRIMDQIANDAIVNELTPRLRGSGLGGLLDATSPESVRGIHAAFGVEGTAGLVNEVGSPNIGRLLVGMTPAQLKTRSDQLSNAVLRNYGADLTGRELNALMADHGISLVRWAGTGQNGGPARTLLNGVQRPALLGLEGSIGPGGTTASQATNLVANLGAPLVNRSGRAVGGRDLATLSETFGPEAAGIVENRVGEAEDQIRRGIPPNEFVKLGQAAEQVRLANIPEAAGGTGELVNPPPMPTGAVIMDSNYYRNLRMAIEKLNRVPPVTPTALEMNVLLDWRARTGAGRDALRVSEVTIGEAARDPTLPRTGFRPLVERTDPLYRQAVAEMAAVNIGGAGVEGAPDRTLMADALFAVPANTPGPEMLTGDRRLTTSLASNFATDAPSRRMGYDQLAAAGGFTIELPGLPGRQVRIVPIARR